MSRQRPLLVMLKGHPGTGKTSVGRCLSQMTGWPLLDKDDSRGPLSALSDTRPDAALNAMAYDIMFQCTATQLQCRNSCIVDCPLARKELWCKACELAEQHGADVVLVELQPPPDEMWKARLDARHSRMGDNTMDSHKPSWEKLRTLLNGYEDCFLWSSAPHVAPRMVLPPDLLPPQAAAQVLDWLDNLPEATSS